MKASVYDSDSIIIADTGHSLSSYNALVLDIDTGEILENVISANDSTGEYIVLIMEKDTKGNTICKMTEDGPLEEKRKGNILIIFCDADENYYTGK